MIQYSYENKKTDSHPTFIGRCYRSLLFSNHYWSLDFLACCPDPSRLTLVAQKSHSRTKNRDGRKIISSISVFLLFPPSNSLKEVNELWNSKESGTEIGHSLEFDFCPTLLRFIYYVSNCCKSQKEWSRWLLQSLQCMLILARRDKRIRRGRKQWSMDSTLYRLAWQNHLA